MKILENLTEFDTVLVAQMIGASLIKGSPPKTKTFDKLPVCPSQQAVYFHMSYKKNQTLLVLSPDQN